MIEVSNVFGGEFDKKKYFDLVKCLNGTQKLQAILSDHNAPYLNTLDTLNEAIAAHISARACSILLFDGKDLVVICSSHKPTIGDRKKVDDGTAYAKTFTNSSPSLMKSKIGDMEYREMIKKRPGLSRSTMLIPLTTTSNECFGMISLSDKKINDKLDFFDQSDLNQLSIISNMIAPTIFWYTREGETRKNADLKDDMVHAVIHDLKSPVFCLKKTLEEFPSQSERVPQDLDLLYHRVVDSLDISRIQNGKLEINKEFIQIKPLLTDALLNLDKYTDYYMVTIEMEEIDDDEGFDGNADLMLRVFENLLTNAIKHSGEENGGTGSIIIKPESTATEIIVSIYDTGTGIPDNFKRLIFDKFTQLKSISGSSGIGLSFCKLIVEAHEGRIEVEDNEPQGSVFKVILPFSGDDEEGEVKSRSKVALTPPSV